MVQPLLSSSDWGSYKLCLRLWVASYPAVPAFFSLAKKVGTAGYEASLWVCFLWMCGQALLQQHEYIITALKVGHMYVSVWTLTSTHDILGV